MYILVMRHGDNGCSPSEIIIPYDIHQHHVLHMPTICPSGRAGAFSAMRSQYF